MHDQSPISPLRDLLSHPPILHRHLFAYYNSQITHKQVNQYLPAGQLMQTALVVAPEDPVPILLLGQAVQRRTEPAVLEY